MKRLFLFLFIVNSISAFCQSNFISLKEMGSEGYIFDKSYKYPFSMDSIGGRFSPTEDEILLAEGLLKFFDTSITSSSRQKRRQYIGYTEGTTKYLLIHVMYFKNEKQFQMDFAGWEKDFSLLFTEPDAKQKSFLYLVNLKDQTIGWPR
jgi:hypothetical protein